MTKLAKLFLALFLAAVPVAAQNYVTVSANNIHDSGSNLLAAGTIYFAPVNSNGQAISYQVGGGGQTINWPVVFTITNGAFSGQLANSALTNPANVCFAVTVKNNRNQVVLGGNSQSGYQCTQTAATNFWCLNAACNFDQYFPQANGIPLVPTPPPSLGSLGGVYSGTCAPPTLAIGYDTNGRVVCGSGTGTGNVTGPSPSVLNDVPGFSNTLGTLLFDTGIPYTNLVTQTVNGIVNDVCTYTATNKVCVPGQVSNAGLVNPSLTINTSAPLSGGGAVALGASLTLGISNIPNNALLNSSIGIAGTTSQIIVSNPSPALGGNTTLSLSNPLILPGKLVLAASTISSTSLNVPTGVAPNSPTTGDFWSNNGLLKFFDGTQVNSLVGLTTAVTAGHCAQFADALGHLSDAGAACGTGGGGGGAVTVNGGATIPSPVNLQNGSASNGLAINVSNASGSNIQWNLSGLLTNAGLQNSTVGVSGTANQIVSTTSTIALGGGTTLAIANPFTFPGKHTASASNTSAASENIPSGVAPATPVSGDLWNSSGVMQFYDGSHTNSFTTIQSAVVNNHCVQFSGTLGLLVDAGLPCNSFSLTVNGGAALSPPVNFQNGSAVNGLSINFLNPTGSTVQAALSGTLTNAGLQNSSITLNGQTVSLGSTGNIPFQTAGVANTSLVGLNFVASSTDAVGLHLAPVNPGTNQEAYEITGNSYTGNAATASAFNHIPVQCAGSQFAVGITSTGAANCSTPGGSGGSAAPNQSVSFTSASSASLTVVAGTQNITWACWDGNSPANSIAPGNVSVNPSTFLVTFNFAVPQTGYCVVNSTGSGVYAAAESGTTWSIPAATHNMGNSVLVATFDNSGNQISGNISVDGSGNVTVAWLTSQVGKVVIAP